MNNKIFIVIGGIVLIIIVGLVIYFVKFNKSGDNPIKEKNPKELELPYDINAGIPFRWEYEIEDPSIVEFVRSYQTRNDNTDGRVGGRIDTNYVFKGLKEGETTIIFKYVYFTENRVEMEDRNIVKVDKDLNITLVEKVSENK